MIVTQAPTSGALKKYTVSTFNAAGYRLWITNAGRARRNIKLAPEFTPDITGYSPSGAFVGIEVKAGKDRLSDGQREWLAGAHRAGCLVGVVGDYDDIPKLIRKWKTHPGRGV